MAIDSYEKLCNAFAGEPSAPERQQANRIFFLQDWMVTVADWADAEGGNYGLDRLLEQIANRADAGMRRKDVVSRLIGDTDTAVRRIAENMRSTIIRENVLQPVYKVREINSYGLSWLSRRPGRTVKEKISNSNASMMAVRRRQSVDTGENRLFLAFLREIADLIDRKEASLPPDMIWPEELEFASRAFRILRDPALAEVRRWENVPPNNTLLSDQNYRKIWRSWNERKEIDEIVREDAESLDLRLADLFFLFLLSEGKKYFAFPQVPVVVDYRSRRVQLCAQFFCGVDASGELVKVRRQNFSLDLTYRGKEIVILFKNDNLMLAGPGDEIRTLPVKAGWLRKYAKMAIGKLGCSHMLPSGRKGLSEDSKCEKAVVDLFQVRPHWSADEGGLQELGGRILFQRHPYRLEDETTVLALPCDQARAIEMAEGIETYSVVSAVEDGRADQLADLARLLGEHIQAKRLTFLFPDVYNEFQISMVHKALRLAFPKVVSFPRSMGAAFSLMRSPYFADRFTCGDFLLVLDLSCDNLSLTLVQSSRDDSLARDIPAFGGLIWERHPTAVESLGGAVEDLTDQLLVQGCIQEKSVYKLLGIQGLASESEKLSILFGEDSVFSFRADTGLSKWRIPVTELVTRYLEKNRHIIGGAKVHILSLSNVLFYKGQESFKKISYDDAIRGYKFFQALQTRTEHVLWREHLPELAIKLLYGKFNLVEDQTVQPMFNLEVRIPITRQFTLVKGKKEYRFMLVSDDLNKKTQYEAVVRNPAFPLDRDVVCRLDMSYRYGDEDPYRLVFIPVGPDAGFAEAKVLWEPAGEYPYMDLAYPGPLQPMSWDELSHFSGWNGVEDLIAGERGVIQYFRQISEGYKTINLDNYQYEIRGFPPKRRFVLELENQGEPLKVTFWETQVEHSGKQEGYARKQDEVSFDNLHVVSFQLSEDTFRARRYRVDLTQDAYGGTVWRRDKSGGHYCIRTVQIDGQEKEIIFFQNMFDPRESFSESISNVSFGVDMRKGPVQGRYRAERIHNEDRGPYKPEPAFLAKRLRNGNIPPNYLYGGRAFFLLHTVFGAGNSALQVNAPPKLTAAFEDARESWLAIYRRCDNSQVKGKLFALMSLCARDLGKPYYMIAAAELDQRMVNPSLPLPGNMGYAFGACASDEERALLERFVQLEKAEPLRAIRLLSKAAWGNPDFIMNVDKSLLLDYFDSAANSLEQICKEKEFDELSRRNITTCLEYILAVYRLRSLGSKEINRYLSRNNPIVRTLYRSLEVMVDAVIDGRLEIRSFLRLDIPDKGVYQAVPDLLYALLVYVAGDGGAGDIRIAGLRLGDIEA